MNQRICIRLVNGQQETIYLSPAREVLGPDEAKTESQNHRMIGVGRDHCGSSSPTPLPKQGHPEQAAQHLVQAGLEYLQRRRLHSLPGQPGPGLRHPQREAALPHLQHQGTQLLLCDSSGIFRPGAGADSTNAVSLPVALWQAAGSMSSTHTAAEARCPSEDAEGLGSFTVEISA